MNSCDFDFLELGIQASSQHVLHDGPGPLHLLRSQSRKGQVPNEFDVKILSLWLAVGI